MLGSFNSKLIKHSSDLTVTQKHLTDNLTDIINVGKLSLTDIKNVLYSLT